MLNKRKFLLIHNKMQLKCFILTSSRNVEMFFEIHVKTDFERVFLWEYISEF